MRLIDTTERGGLTTFSDNSIPPYAILSHRWRNEDEEVSYKLYQKSRVPSNLPGSDKIEKLRQIAADRGFQWAWIDTCCIDKRSSTELSKAINSMYKWYERSAECYVYLADVDFSASELSLKSQSEDAFWDSPGGWSTFKGKFSNSCWFKRGWTLQELIAPNKIIFYDRRWNEISSVEHVYKEVAKVTKIGEQWLAPPHMRSPRASIATRMSWASYRKTSEKEDLAYCLLGLFNVSMPLLYGEGAEKAFYRLQTEIMKISDDESLFAWTSEQGGSGLLAAHPSYFKDSGDVVEETITGGTSRPPYFMTNKGVAIALPKKHLLPSSQKKNPVRFYLRCLRGYTQNAQMRDKALYIELDLQMGLKSFIRINCAQLKETQIPPDKGEYTIDQLNRDLLQNERVYVFSPSSGSSGYWGTFV